MDPEKNQKAKASGEGKPSTGVNHNAATFNYVIGTQSIKPEYGRKREEDKRKQQHGKTSKEEKTAAERVKEEQDHEARLLESAEEILKMGSNIIKFKLPYKDLRYKGSNLTTIANTENIKKIFNMKFSHILMWVYPVGFTSGDVELDQEKEKERLRANYDQIYALTCYLLKQYTNRNKTFFIGNWEGDWHLLRGKKEENLRYVPSQREIDNMINWINKRQNAVDNAKRDTPHNGVEVFHYLEVNRVQDAMLGKIRLTNMVLPHTDIDYVSYSCYDSTNEDDKDKNPSGEKIEVRLPKALNYISSQLKKREGLPYEKRVWIGEYGFRSVASTKAVEQDEKSRRVMRVALEWQCPFVLYWQFYSNLEDGEQRGYWLINDKDEKQPTFYTHEKFLRQAKKRVTDYIQKHKTLPPHDVFCKSMIPNLLPPSKL